jgi:hypothetical protein
MVMGQFNTPWLATGRKYVIWIRQEWDKWGMNETSAGSHTIDTGAKKWVGNGASNGISRESDRNM